MWHQWLMRGRDGNLNRMLNKVIHANSQVKFTKNATALLEAVARQAAFFRAILSSGVRISTLVPHLPLRSWLESDALAQATDGCVGGTSDGFARYDQFHSPVRLAPTCVIV